jgi:hypothetical protein
LDHLNNHRLQTLAICGAKLGLNLLASQKSQLEFFSISGYPKATYACHIILPASSRETKSNIL